MECELCGKIISKLNWTTHIKTKKHRKLAELGIKADNEKKIMCPCGALVDKYYLKYHVKTDLHNQKYLPFSNALQNSSDLNVSL